MAIQCAIIGGSGYTGGELLRILSAHPGVEITCVTSRKYAGMPISALFPSLQGIVDINFEDYSPESLKERAQIAFTAVPHQAAMPVVRELLDAGLKVIDLSADFRLHDANVYENWYGEHSQKELLERAIYGLPEIYKEKIKAAELVANPGCYPTSAILPLYPILKRGIVDSNGIIIDSKSGVSGAGRTSSSAFGYSEVNEGFKAYKVCEHRHTPEIEQELSMASGAPLTLNFTPHLVPMTRGILTTSYSKLKEDVDEQELIDILRDFYNKSPFVRVLDQGLFPDCHNVRGSNFCDIGVRVCKRTNTLILISAIDNLVKGASGQAVQNMNIMEGLDETIGLQSPPLFP